MASGDEGSCVVLFSKSKYTLQVDDFQVVLAFLEGWVAGEDA